jgi:hypothetical protein
MSALFVLPALVSLILVIRGRVEIAFLWVYLPALLLLPNGYVFNVPHMPAISAAQGALIPIGAIALYRLVRSGVPSFLDILMVLFMICLGVSEITREHVTNDGVFLTFTAFLSIFLAYVTGRKIIEPGLRHATVKRIIILILLMGPLGFYEWRMGQSLYGVVGQEFFQTTAVQSNVQLRAGRGRMAVSFNDAELAGIVFGMTLALNSWLFYRTKAQSSDSPKELPGWLEKVHLPGVLLFGYLLLTQSRGPLIGMAAAAVILQIPRFKSRKLATCGVVLLLATAAYGSYLYFLRYTNVADRLALADERRGSAVYRRQMNELYQPIAQEGGWLGWGYLSHPRIGGMPSIDNEYLLIQLSYGKLGLILFLLIGAETFRRLIVNVWRLKAREDTAFAVSLLGAMAVFWITIYTVYMGEQLPQVAFLLIGWSQSIVPASAEASAIVEVPARPKFAFKRVFG